MKNIKCILGFHDWKYYKLKSRTCKVCTKKQKSYVNFASDYDGIDTLWK